MVWRLVMMLLVMSPGLGLAREECCPHIEITSRGEAAQRQPQRLGVFSVVDQGWADRPIYKHQHYPEYLFYLQSKSKGLWMVGPKVGNFDGGLASPADDICPHDVAQGQWRFTDGRAWRKDRKLSVKCLESLEDSQENKNEVNGKFKIMNLKWDERLRNPKSLKYKTLANTIEGDIKTMLTEKDELNHQADFTVSVERFKRGSVVVNFKVDYILKHAVLAIPFKLNPDNITDTLAKDFQYQNGILFSRFAIAANSFNGTVYRDQCSVRGCSHKCSYDYDQEDYLCTCPRTLELNTDRKTCGPPALELPPSTGETVPLPNITTEENEELSPTTEDNDELIPTTKANEEDSTVKEESVSITERFDDDGTTISIEDEITDITSPLSPPSTTTATTATNLEQQNTQLPVVTTDFTLTEDNPEATAEAVETNEETTTKVITELTKDTTVAMDIVTIPETTTIETTEATKDSTPALNETSKDSDEDTTELTTTTTLTTTLATTTTQSDSSEILELRSQFEENPETTETTSVTTRELTELEVTTYTVVEEEVKEIEADKVEGEEEEEEEEGIEEKDDEEKVKEALETTTENFGLKNKETTADLTLTTIQPTTTDTESKKESQTELSTTETATEISVELQDDQNAVIDISGVYKLICTVTDEDHIDLNCEDMEGAGRRVHLVIDKDKVRGDLNKIWEDNDNVRLIVESLLVEDIPKY